MVFLWRRETDTLRIDTLFYYYYIVLIHGVARNAQQQLAVSVYVFCVCIRHVHSNQSRTLISVEMSWIVCTRKSIAQIQLGGVMKQQKANTTSSCTGWKGTKWRDLSGGCFSKYCGGGSDYHWGGKRGCGSKSSELSDWIYRNSAAGRKVRRSKDFIAAGQFRNWDILRNENI